MAYLAKNHGYWKERVDYENYLQKLHGSAMNLSFSSLNDLQKRPQTAGQYFCFFKK